MFTATLLKLLVISRKVKRDKVKREGSLEREIGYSGNKEGHRKSMVCGTYLVGRVMQREEGERV